TPGEQARTQLRELIAALVGEAVGAEQDDARFLDLGLDSLALTQLALELRRRYGLDLKLRRLSEDLDCIAKLAALVELRPDDASAAGASMKTSMSPDAMRIEPASEARSEIPFGAAARITREAHTVLTPRQRDWLDAFAARYTAHTAKSKAACARHRAGMADPRAVTGFNPAWKELVYPIVVERSLGPHLWDVDG